METMSPKIGAWTDAVAERLNDAESPLRPKQIHVYEATDTLGEDPGAHSDPSNPPGPPRIGIVATTFKSPYRTFPRLSLLTSGGPKAR